jgi:hypothetical protein
MLDSKARSQISKIALILEAISERSEHQNRRLDVLEEGFTRLQGLVEHQRKRLDAFEWHLEGQESLPEKGVG